MEAFILQFPALVSGVLYGGGLLLGGAIMWMVRKAISMLSVQDTTLARIERKTNSHDDRIRSLEWHAWGKEPPRDAVDDRT